MGCVYEIMGCRPKSFSMISRPVLGQKFSVEGVERPHSTDATFMEHLPNINKIILMREDCFSAETGTKITT